MLSAAEVIALQQQVRQVRVEDSLNDYMLDLVEATRKHPGVWLGGSTRAALMLYRAAQALALLWKRDYVIPDDIKRLARPVLAHRLVSKSFRHDGRDDAGDRIVDEIMSKVPVPK